MEKKLVQNLLYKELSYAVHGAAIEVRKDFGPGHKEKLYQEALAKELKRRNIVFEKEKAIKIYAPKDGQYMGLYRPDFIIDNKIIVEVKAEKFVSRDEIKRIYDYLRNSEYELAYFINFTSPRLYTKRIILTNDRKPFNKPLINTNNKLNYTKKLLVSIGFILVLFSGLPSIARAATTVYFDLEKPAIHQGDTFLVSLKISTPDKSINVVDGTILYNNNLEIKEVSTGGSLFALWPKPPAFSNDKGALSFVGGVPEGFQGKEGEVLKMIFFAKSEGEAKIDFLDGFSVFLNNGQGTQINPWLRPLSLNILERPPEIPATDEWQILLESDKNPPEPFEIAIGQNPGVFNNQYFVNFFTADKESGIDHYEIQEGARPYVIGSSPYLLKDQKLTGMIKVKAVDKAGNEWVAELVPTYPPRFYQTIRFWLAIISVIIIVLIFVKIKAAKKKPNGP